jgi:glycerol-3-phosphate dehydrogenase subunit C
MSPGGEGEREGLVELIRSSLDHCVKCTVCETYCPVAAATPLFPGPKYAGPQAERYRGTGPSPDASLDYCSGCGICTQVCPQGVKIAEINARARVALKARTGVPLRDRIIARPALTARLATPVAGIANRLLANPTVRRLMQSAIGIHREAPMPRFAGSTFQRWSRRHPSPPAPATRTVVYFHGCSSNYFEPELARMTVAVLEHNGFRVIVPRQGCCGLPLQSNGLAGDARRAVRRLVGHLAPLARHGFDIVATSTSCSLMLKREAGEVLGLEDADLHLVAGKTYDICEFLAGVHERGELRTDFVPLPLRVPYHAPCQQKSHGMGRPALDLLALIPELEVIELDRECCGIAGTYGLKQEKYDIAMKVGSGLFADVAGARADLAACDSETCRWQITHGTGVATVHPIELLYQAYRLGPRPAPPGA